VPKETKAIDDGTFLDRVGDEPAAAHGTDPHPRSGEPASNLLDTQPALQYPDWLPEGLFPEIDKLREEHIAGLAAIQEAGNKLSALKELYENEDAARAEALRVGGDVPVVTMTATRIDTLRDADAERLAKVAQLADFVDRAIATFAELEPEWREQFGQMAAEAEAKQAEAREALRVADAEAARVARHEVWLDRTIHPWGGRFMSAPQVAPVEDIDELMRVAP
jgi:hypothetical protein